MQSGCHTVGSQYGSQQAHIKIQHEFMINRVKSNRLADIPCIIKVSAVD